MVEDNPPDSPSRRHARLMCQAQSPDPHTRILAQQRLVDGSQHVFHRFARGKKGWDVDEATQSARVAFALNIPKFNPDAGVQYTTYAHKMMVREVASNERTNYGKPSPQKVKRWVEVQDASDGEVQIPVWTSVGKPNESGEEATFEDAIPDLMASEAFAIAPLRVDVQRFVTSLPQREQDVYRLLYMEQKTQAEAAKELGISQPCVNQMHNRIKSRGETQLAHLAPMA